jgi:site-specific DNA-methyltransferase (adenine-specific)
MLDFGFYNMDCMEGMKQFPDKYFDLAIVDPPYGDAKLSENSGGYWNRFGQRFDRYKHSSTGEERATARRSMGLSALVEDGRGSTQKNHCVGHSPRKRVF